MTPDFSTIESLAAAQSLAVFGGFHPDPGDLCPEDTDTLILLGPQEPGFWAHLTAQPEWRDTAADPIDRWSARAVGTIAEALGGVALMPSYGPPYHPFYAWALRTGRAWASPVRLLVHDQAGLMVSFRGAVALKQHIMLPATTPGSPCETCVDKPCLAACPAGALGPDGYNVPACHRFLDQPGGQSCLSFGCHTRRACPLSYAYGRLPEQSAYHMRLFHP